MPTAKKTAAAKKTTRTPAKPAPRKASPRKPAAAPAAPKSAEPAKTPGADKAAKPKRVALVRDGFTMPAADFKLIATLKSRAMASQREAKKSELLRAGLRALDELSPAELVQALNRLEPVKTGRPKKAH
jgi:hypothetical protein